MYTCDGRGISTPLSWKGLPPRARSLALRLYDPDAAGFTHWLAWGISIRSPGLPSGQRPPKQGRNDFGRIGYGAPCPPKGTPHHYIFVLYVLAKPLDLRPGVSKGRFASAISHAYVLARAQLIGVYKRR